MYLEKVPLSIIWLDLKGIIINANSAIEQIFRSRKEELLNKSFIEIATFPDGFRPLFEERYKNLLEGETLEPIELQVYRPDNDVIWINIQGSLVQLGDEAFIQITIQDITEYKEKEEKVRELSKSEGIFQLIAGNSDDLIALMNLKTEFEFINEIAFRRVLGYSKEDLLGRKSLEFIHPADLEPTTKAFLKGIEVGEGKIETRARCKDGHYLWLEMQGRTFEDKTGELKAIMIARDITERKQIEEVLRETEERYKALFDRTLFGIYLHDFNGNFLDANEAALNLLGYSREEIPSLNFASLLSDDQLPQALATLQELKETGSQKTLTEYRLQSKNGDYIWVETEASLLYRQGKPYAIQGIARDVTERKYMEKILQESEKKYRNIIENIKDAVVIIGLDGKFQFISSQLSEILGKREIGEDLSSIAHLIHKDDIKSLLNVFQKASKAKKVLIHEEVEFRVQHQDGHYIWLASSSKPHYDENGEMIGYLVLLRDITDRKETEEIRIRLLQEMQSHKELEEINRLKDELYADISHELRTPLTIIKGFTEFFLEAPNLNCTQKNDLRIILKNEMRLERLINEMLDYSRLKSGHIQLYNEPFRISAIVTEIKNEFEIIIKSNKLVFEEEFNPDVEVILDKNQIMKVIRNLLSNAIKFSFLDGTIFIKSLIEEGLWTFSVQDQGVGISGENIPKLFSRFIKLKQDENINPNGIGIGLVICKKTLIPIKGRFGLSPRD